MVKNETLKMCPFCGSTKHLQTDMVIQDPYSPPSLDLNELPAEEWFVVCGDCGAMGPISTSADEAHAAWNSRS